MDYYRNTSNKNALLYNSSGTVYEIFMSKFLGKAGHPRDRKELGLTVRAGATIYKGALFGWSCHVGHNAVIREDNICGNFVSVGSFTELGPRNTIGHNSRIHSHGFVVNADIGQHVFIGPRVTFTDDPHPACPVYKKCSPKTVVEDLASIGANVTILPGVRIGKGALVGAGSLVTKDVAPWTVVVGSPAQMVKRIILPWSQHDGLDEIALHYEKIYGVMGCKAGFFRQPYEWREPVNIVCPDCGTVNLALVDHSTVPFSGYTHFCNECSYIITESEWNKEEEIFEGYTE